MSSQLKYYYRNKKEINKKKYQKNKEKYLKYNREHKAERRLNMIQYQDRQRLKQEKQQAIERRRIIENPLLYKDYYTEEEFYGKIE